MKLKKEVSLTQIATIIALFVCAYGFYEARNLGYSGTIPSMGGKWDVTMYRRTGLEKKVLAHSTMGIFREPISGRMQFKSPLPSFFREKGHPLPKVLYTVQGELTSPDRIRFKVILGRHMPDETSAFSECKWLAFEGKLNSKESGRPKAHGTYRVVQCIKQETNEFEFGPTQEWSAELIDRSKKPDLRHSCRL